MLGWAEKTRSRRAATVLGSSRTASGCYTGAPRWLDLDPYQPLEEVGMTNVALACLVEVGW